VTTIYFSWSTTHTNCNYCECCQCCTCLLTYLLTYLGINHARVCTDRGCKAGDGDSVRVLPDPQTSRKPCVQLITVPENLAQLYHSNHTHKHTHTHTHTHSHDTRTATYTLYAKDIARQSCAMVPRWRFFASFLRPVFPASRVQRISDLRSKFALGPHHVWKYGRHPI